MIHFSEYLVGKNWENGAFSPSLYYLICFISNIFVIQINQKWLYANTLLHFSFYSHAASCGQSTRHHWFHHPTVVREFQRLPYSIGRQWVEIRVICTKWTRIQLSIRPRSFSATSFWFSSIPISWFSSIQNLLSWAILPRWNQTFKNDGSEQIHLATQLLWRLYKTSETPWKWGDWH